MLLAGPALAAPLSDVPPAQSEDRPDKSGYNLFNPTPRELMREMSTDRPDTTESPYTVDAGHVQVEFSLVDYSYDRRNAEHVTARSIAVAPMLVKIGLLNDVDFQLGIDPYTRSSTLGRATNERQIVEGFGDTLLRLKVNLWGNDEGETALAVMPFVNIPTAADGVGSERIEGGLIVPLSIALAENLSLGVMAEFDLVWNESAGRYGLDFVHTASLAIDLAEDLGGFVEYAGFARSEADEDYRAYFDTGLTYSLTADVQLDCGVRIGLTQSAEDAGVFAGVSLRF
jgi:hypothetical protein